MPSFLPWNIKRPKKVKSEKDNFMTDYGVSIFIAFDDDFMNRYIIIYAPTGKSVSPERIGGAEAGCMKTMKILREAGFCIILLEKPVRKKSLLSYVARLLYTWMRLVTLLFMHRKATLHIVGCYRELMYVEWAFTLTAKVLRHKTVYDIRNGDMIKEYEKRGDLYKHGMLSLLKRNDSVLCQGIDYVRFIEDKLGKSALYYPNYIQDRFTVGSYPKREMQQCRLVYFGRIVPAKNIDVMLEICHILHERGMSPTLDLIGGCSDAYKQELETNILKAGISGKVRFWGRKDVEEFFPYLRTCHFFLFPSNNYREGHSNSLTEAMGCGIVPVVSNVGFNRQVVDDDRLVISEADNAVMYANVIFGIWTSGGWESYSRKMYFRVIANFTEKSVRETLLEAYQ